MKKLELDFARSFGLSSLPYLKVNATTSPRLAAVDTCPSITCSYKLISSPIPDVILDALERIFPSPNSVVSQARIALKVISWDYESRETSWHPWKAT
jgi:hypothetical protein